MLPHTTTRLHELLVAHLQYGCPEAFVPCDPLTQCEPSNPPFVPAGISPGSRSQSDRPARLLSVQVMSCGMDGSICGTVGTGSGQEVVGVDVVDG